MRHLLAALLALPLLGQPAIAQDDDDGAGFLTRFLQDSLSEAGREVRISGFRGAISSRARIDRMTIADDEGVWVELRDVTMHWNRAAALRRRIQINELTAAEIELSRLPEGEEGGAPAPEATPFALPELPVAVNIDELRADRVSIGAPVFGEAVEFSLSGEANIADGEGRAALAAERIDGPRGRFALDAAFSNETRELSLGLELAEEAGGIAARLIGLPDTPELELSVQGDGPLSDFAADLRLATDGVDRLAGRVELREELAEEGDPDSATRRFEADLQGDMAPLFAPDFTDFFGDELILRTEGAQHPDGRFELEDMVLRARALDIAGRVVIGADGLPEFVDVGLDIADPEGEPVVLPIGGPRTRIDEARLRLDYDAERSEDWDIDGTVRNLDRPDLDIDTLRLWGDGRITRGDGANGRGVRGALRYAASGIAPQDADLARALGDEIVGALRVIWSEGEPVQLPSLALRGADYSLAGSATIDGLDIDGRVSARLDDLSRFEGLAGQPIAGRLRGEIGGSLDPLSAIFDLDMALEGRDLAAGIDALDGLLAGDSRIAGNVRRDTEGTTIRDFTVNAATLAARIDGAVRSAGSEIDADLDFSDLSVMGAQYGGALRAEARLRDANGAERITMDAEARDIVTGLSDELDALLAGRSTIELDATRRGEQIEIAGLDVAASTLAIRATGLYTPGASDLTADLDFDDLSVLGAQYGGAVSATARLRERDGAEHVAMNATARDLATGLSDELDGLLRGQSTIALEATRRGEQIEIAQLEVDGAALSAQLEGLYAPGASDLRGVLDFRDLGALGAQYRGALTAEAELSEDGARRDIRLSAEGRGLAIGQPEADAVLAGTTRLSLAAREEDGAINVDDLELTNPQLDVSAAGVVDGDERRVDVSARLADLGLVLDGFSGPLQVGGTVDDLGARGYALDLAGTGPGEIDFTVTGRMAADLTSDLRIQGTAALGLINRFVDPISILGPARYDLRLVGQPGLDALRGTISTEGTRIVVPAGNVRLEDVAATAELGPAGADIDARANVADGGSLSAQGRIGLAAPFEGDLGIALDAVRLRDPDLFDTSVSGELAVTGPLQGGGAIRGALSLGETQIRVPSTGLGGPGYIPLTLEHVNESATSFASRVRAGLIAENGERGTARPFALDIGISAPNRIFIRGRGLDAELGGSLDITGTTQNIVPVGDFSLIRGRLDLLGNRFNLTEGSAVLSGRFIPVLRLVATTETDGISASIVIEGEATEPEIRFESAPPLPEEEVVARILFGRGLDNISALQAAQLAQAVATLTGRGGDGVVGNLRRNFGLDDLDVYTGDDDEVGVRAGRYITENVYTDVTVDSEGRSEVSINLDVSRSVTLRGRADTEGRTGVGVFFERDY